MTSHPKQEGNMELNKANIKKIILILLVAITFCIGLINLSSVWAAVAKILSVLTPIIIGLCIAFILSPLTTTIETRMLSFLAKRFPKRGRAAARGLSIFMSIIIVAGIIALIILLVIPAVNDAFSQIFADLPKQITTLVGKINDLLARFNIDFRIPLSKADDWTTLIDQAKDKIQSAFDSGILNDIASTTLSVISGLTNFILGIILSLYVLTQKEKIGNFISRLIRAYSSEKASARIFKVAHLTKVSFRNFVTGQLTEALIIGMLCLFGMLIFNFPYPAATSAVVGLMALVPVFGSWIGAILGGLLCLSRSFPTALLFVLFFIILQQLEGNFIYPRVVGKSVGLPGILVFISVILGASIGGILGIVLSVPICSILFVLIKEAVDKRLKKKKVLDNLENLGIISSADNES